VLDFVCLKTGEKLKKTVNFLLIFIENLLGKCKFCLLI
jgi:hypothetical protein